MCILQKEKKQFTIYSSIVILPSPIGHQLLATVNTEVPIQRLKRQLPVPLFMDIIILMTWSIWTTRNDWIFNGQDPTVQACHEKFKKEFVLAILRAPDRISSPHMKEWLHPLQ